MRQGLMWSNQKATESRLLKDSFDRYLARWGNADRMREYNGQMGLWVSNVQSTLTAAVVL
jgi:hypothetical protein